MGFLKTSYRLSNLGEQPVLRRILKQPSLLTRSNTSVRSTSNLDYAKYFLKRLFLRPDLKVLNMDAV